MASKSQQQSGPRKRAFCLVKEATVSGVSATRGQADMRGLATAGPGFVSEPAV
jgi:hypothetical protein